MVGSAKSLKDDNCGDKECPAGTVGTKYHAILVVVIASSGVLMIVKL